MVAGVAEAMEAAARAEVTVVAEAMEAVVVLVRADLGGWAAATAMHRWIPPHPRTEQAA